MFAKKRNLNILNIFTHLSLVFFGIKPPYSPQSLSSSKGTLPEPFGSVDVQDADRKRADDKLVIN